MGGSAANSYFRVQEIQSKAVAPTACMGGTCRARPVMPHWGLSSAFATRGRCPQELESPQLVGPALEAVLGKLEAALAKVKLPAALMQQVRAGG